MKNNNKPFFLIIDDDDKFRLSLTESTILSDFADLYGISNCENAYQFLIENNEKVDLILLDYDFRQYGTGDQMDGLKLLEIITEKWKHIPVIMMSGITDIRGKVALEAINKLAYKFLDKPFDIEEVIQLYKTYISTKISTDCDVGQLREKLKKYGLVTNNKNFLEKILLGIEAIQKKTDRIITIIGETGSGKSHLARVIHKIVSKTDTEPAIVHCSNLGTDINTIRDYLFGHTKNSWTGANYEKSSIFKNAETVIFDDIQHISKEAQKILLEVFQEKHYSVFGKESIKEKIKSRIIVTSTMDPEELLKLGFLEEFVNRITAEIIAIPPLRKRIEDIPFLIDQFASKFSNRKIIFEQNLVNHIIEKYQYRNVRELQHFIDDLIVHSNDDYISFDVLRKLLVIKSEKEQLKINQLEMNKNVYNLEEDLYNLRKRCIENALEKYHGNIKKASEALGYKNHNGLLHWIKKLNINVRDYKK